MQTSHYKSLLSRTPCFTMHHEKVACALSFHNCGDVRGLISQPQWFPCLVHQRTCIYLSPSICLHPQRSVSQPFPIAVLLENDFARSPCFFLVITSTWMRKATVLLAPLPPAASTGCYDAISIHANTHIRADDHSPPPAHHDFPPPPPPPAATTTPTAPVTPNVTSFTHSPTHSAPPAPPHCSFS